MWTEKNQNKPKSSENKTTKEASKKNQNVKVRKSGQSSSSNAVLQLTL